MTTAELCALRDKMLAQAATNRLLRHGYDPGSWTYVRLKRNHAVFKKVIHRWGISCEADRMGEAPVFYYPEYARPAVKWLLKKLVEIKRYRRWRQYLGKHR